jgi:hypothetical protein
MLSKASIMITIGGAGRTKDEIISAEKRNIPIVPIGMSGGTSYTIWLEYQTFHDKSQYESYQKLNNINPFIATAGTIEINKSILRLKEW